MQGAAAGLAGAVTGTLLWPGAEFNISGARPLRWGDSSDDMQLDTATTRPNSTIKKKSMKSIINKRSAEQEDQSDLFQFSELETEQDNSDVIFFNKSTDKVSLL